MVKQLSSVTRAWFRALVYVDLDDALLCDCTDSIVSADCADIGTALTGDG